MRRDEQRLGLVKKRVASQLANLIREIVLAVVEEAVVSSASEKVLDADTIVQVREKARRVVRGLAGELLRDGGPLHLRNDGASELETGVHMLLELQPDRARAAMRRPAFETSLRLLIGNKCVEILSPFGLGPRLVKSTREAESSGDCQPLAVTPDGAEFFGLFYWKLRHLLITRRRIAALLKRKKKLEDRIARLEPGLSGCERAQVEFQREWLRRHGRRASDREMDQERSRRRRVWMRP
jgi:hypothetical protein